MPKESNSWMDRLIGFRHAEIGSRPTPTGTTAGSQAIQPPGRQVSELERAKSKRSQPAPAKRLVCKPAADAHEAPVIMRQQGKAITVSTQLFRHGFKPRFSENQHVPVRIFKVLLAKNSVASGLNEATAPRRKLCHRSAAFSSSAISLHALRRSASTAPAGPSTAAVFGRLKPGGQVGAIRMGIRQPPNRRTPRSSKQAPAAVMFFKCAARCPALGERILSHKTSSTGSGWPR